MTVTYEVEVLRSGQPRAYADTERECLISVKREGKPWLMCGNLDERIAEEAELRKRGQLYGGMTADDLRRTQREWALRLVRALFQNFREKGDEDGRTGMDAHFYPTLRSLTIDQNAGTIRAFIIEPFTD